MTVISDTSRQTYAFCFPQGDEEIGVRISLPDLEKASCETWGDWGPMHDFDISSADPVVVCYGEQTTKLRGRCVSLRSPMRAAERDRFPFYLELRDAETGKRFRLFLDREQKCCEVEVSRAFNQTAQRFALREGGHSAGIQGHAA